MRTSASGLASMMAVAIDQILRLAPSISGPIEPVVSSTNATSTIGRGRIARDAGSSVVAKAGAVARTAAKQAGISARAMSANIVTLLNNVRRGYDSQASRRGMVRIVADHRRIAG